MGWGGVSASFVPLAERGSALREYFPLPISEKTHGEHVDEELTFRLVYVGLDKRNGIVSKKQTKRNFVAPDSLFV